VSAAAARDVAESVAIVFTAGTVTNSASPPVARRAVLAARLASGADAVNPLIHHHLTSDTGRPDPAAALLHDPDDFVPQDLRSHLEGDGQTAVVGVVVAVAFEDVEVRAAEAYRRHADPDFAWTGRAHSDVLNLHAACGRQHGGAHGVGSGHAHSETDCSAQIWNSRCFVSSALARISPEATPMT
jgi:hypothetical protein